MKKWMVAYPHQNLTHSEVLINNNSTSNWVNHNSMDNSWTSIFIGTERTYPSNEPQSVNKTSWNASTTVYWWFQSVNYHENFYFTTTGCNDMAIHIANTCSGYSGTRTYLSIRWWGMRLGVFSQRTWWGTLGQKYLLKLLDDHFFRIW